MRINLDFKIAIRSILKNKVQSLISILGLGIGLGCILLLTLLYLHENSFNKTVPDNDSLYRVALGDNCRTTYPLAETAKDEIPGIESFFRLFQKNEFNIRTEDNEILLEKNIACTDPTLFKLWGVEFLVGQPAKSPLEVAISKKMAKKHFNSVNPINETIEARLNNEFVTLTVCGVYKDFPANSTLYPEFVCNIDFFGEFLGARRKMLGAFGNENNSYKNDWQRGRFVTFLKLNSGLAKNDVEKSLQQ